MRAAGGKAGGGVRSWTGGDQRRSRKSVHADGVVIAGLTLPTGSWGHVSARLAATAARADASRMSDLCMVLQRQAKRRISVGQTVQRERRATDTGVPAA